MECPFNNREDAAILLDFCERKLSPEMMDAMSRHVDHCARCRTALDAQRAVWRALDSWQPETVSADFNRRLYQRIDAEAARGWWRTLLGPLYPMALRPVIPMTAASLLVAGLFLLHTPEPPAPGDTQQAAVLDTIDADQVETTLDDVEMLHELGVAQVGPAVNPEEPPSQKKL